MRFLNAANSIMQAANKHYVTIFMGGVCEDGEPQVSLIRSYIVPIHYALYVCMKMLTSWRSPSRRNARAGNGFRGMSCECMER